jgi:hypothetical protein
MSWRATRAVPGLFAAASACAGKWRILADETSVNLRMDRFKFSSHGVFGAKPARASKGSLEPRQSDGTCVDLESGWRAPPARRSPVGGIRRRRRLGRSPSARDRPGVRGCGARLCLARLRARRYGVALDADLAVDDAATARLRGEKTAR